MRHAILLDFGSTYTKMVCVDLTQREVVLTDKFPSTVHSDAGINLSQCFEAARNAIGEASFENALKLSGSSAAGGLKIAVSGLTKSLSIEAGRYASFGAGGKVIYTASGLISEEDIGEIQSSWAEILLLCGGYEGGNSLQVLRNAELLSHSSLAIPIIYAGNSYVARDVRTMLTSRGKECFLAENMMPEIGRLNTSSVIAMIRDLFMERITNMKGVGMVKEKIDGPILPTPAAVLAAGELLFQGTGKEPGIGPYMLVDVGGATTDIYSFIENRSYGGAKIVGTPEPLAKRTVEGDLGMRESSMGLVKEVGTKYFEETWGKEYLERAIHTRMNDRKYIADTPMERKLDCCIAGKAIGISARRHAGYVVKEFNDGCRLVQHGKNLTQIETVIGTGGILVNHIDTAKDMLENVKIIKGEEGRVLLPNEAEPMVDEDYVFFAAGLLRNYDEEAALAIMKKSIGR